MAKVTKVVQEEIMPDVDAIDDAAGPPHSRYNIPLFDSAGLDPSKVPGGIGVTREDPPDGYIGHFPPTTTKEDLKRLVGGYVLSLELKDARGLVMTGGSKTMLRIDAPPVQTAAAKANLEELRKGGGALGVQQNADQFARILEMQRTEIDAIRTRSNDSVALLRAELTGAAERRAADADAAIRRMNEEAKIRGEEAEAKHKRELEMQRQYQESQTQREREQRQLEKAQHTEMIGMIQAQNAQQTQVVVASMGNRTDPMAIIAQLMTLAAPLLPMLSGQGDPAVEITKAVSQSLESITRLAVDKPGGESKRANGKEIVRANGSKAPTDGTSAKERIIGKVGKLFQAVQSAGQDPEAILDGAIAHYEAQGKQAPAGELEEEEEEEQTPTHAPKRAGKPTRRRKKPVVLARRNGTKPNAASKSAVGRRAKAHGKPAPAGRARGNTARGKN